MKHGYAGVSTEDQTPALQLAALKKAGCKTIFKDDGLSGATTKRPALLRCLKKLEHGDTLTVWKLDRLGRSLRDLITMLAGWRRAQLCGSGCCISAGDAHPQTPFCARAATPRQQHLSPRQAFRECSAGMISA
jgi:hypothetical protein